MNKNFALFHLAMARPGEKSGAGGAVALAAVIVGVVIVAMAVVPFVSG